jgi:hypothetical protein
MSEGPVCTPRRAPDLSGVRFIRRLEAPADYRAALAEAQDIARHELTEPMLLSWYDRDRDFEAPQHVSECHADAAVPGYVDYALSRGATLAVDFGEGRFVFFFRDAT